MNHPLCVTHRNELDTIFAHYAQQLQPYQELKLGNLFGWLGKLIPTKPLLPVPPAPSPSPVPTPLLPNLSEVFTKLIASLWQVLSKGTTSGTPSGATDVKSAITEAVLQFYDAVVVPLFGQMTGLPNLVTLLISPLLRQFLPSIIGGIVDGLIKVTAGPANTPPAPGQPNPTGFVPY